MMPIISIIIPVYNTEKYLRECLDSVLSQSLTEIEVLCVNDGSTDSSLEILNEYAAKDPRVAVINSETNNGLASARDLGLGQTKGKWVKFVDSDDLLPNGTLERQVKAAEAGDVDILVHSAEPFLESEVLSEHFKGLKDCYSIHREYPDVLSGPDYFQQVYENKDYRPEVWLRFFRADFLAKNDFSFKMKLFSSEDEYFTTITSLYADRVIVLNEVGYRYRIRENSIMTAPVSIKYLRSRFIVCGVMREELSKVPTDRMRPAVGKHIVYVENELSRLAAALREQGFTPETDYDRYMFDVIEISKKNIEKRDLIHETELQGILNSPSYKIGRAFTAPFRIIRDLLRKK